MEDLVKLKKIVSFLVEISTRLYEIVKELQTIASTSVGKHTLSRGQILLAQCVID